MARAAVEIHHSTGLWQLVVCDGSRYGRTLNHYVEKKPGICLQCGHWKKHRCGLGYITHRKSKACSQAISIIEMVKRGL